MQSIKKTDVYPLWSFGYMTKPLSDDPAKVITSRGRTWQEAWVCVQEKRQSFSEPSKVGVCGNMSVDDGRKYSALHPYDWLHEAPLWLKLQQNALDTIW